MSLDPPPRDQLIEFSRDGKPKWTISARWLDWLLTRDAAIGQAALQLPPILLTGKEASIGATIINTGSLNTRRMEAAFFSRIVRAGGVSSSLTTRFGFTRGGVACVFPFPANPLIANTTDAVQSETFVIPCDAGTSLTYETIYASAGVPTMQYETLLIVKALN